MINVSTKKGDNGQTSLANGELISKADLRLDVVGDLDELNSWLGVVVAHLDDELLVDKNFLSNVQNELFTLGAELAKAKKVKLGDHLLKDIEKRSVILQKKLDKNWHAKFLIPGGCKQAAWLDVSRTVCRRAERNIAKLSQVEEIRPILLKTVNRLSDYLYLLRCYVNYKLEIEEKVKS